MQTKKFLDSDGLSYFYSLLNNTFIKNESISDWAKLPTKPTYTANEVGALSTSTHYAGSTSVAGPANKAVSIPFGQVDSTSTSTVFTATIDGITELRDGVCVYLKNGVVTSASGWTLNINNLGAKPVYLTLAAASASTAGFNINYTMLFVYNSNRVAGGCWDMFYGYNSNDNTVAYFTRTNYSPRPASAYCGRYRIVFSSSDDTKWVPSNTSTSTNVTAKRDVNQEKINPFGRICYYNSTSAISAGAMFGTSTVWDQYPVSLGYSFNRKGSALTLPINSPIYIKCHPLTDGSAIIDADEPYVTELPNSEDGLIYIHIGYVYSATNIEMTQNKPVYYYKDGAIRLWTGVNYGGVYYSN